MDKFVDNLWMGAFDSSLRQYRMLKLECRLERALERVATTLAADCCGVLEAASLGRLECYRPPRPRKTRPRGSHRGGKYAYSTQIGE